jgi:hypothetical protein
MTTIDEATGEIIDEPRTFELATAPDTSGIDLADAPLTWQALVRIADTDFVPRSLRGNPNAVLACIFTGREVGPTQWRRFAWSTSSTDAHRCQPSSPSRSSEPPATASHSSARLRTRAPSRASGATVATMR